MFQKIGNQFKRPSGFLGKVVSMMMMKGNRHAYETLLRDWNLKDNDKILEIGYGPGIGIRMLASRFDHCEIHGIDFSELMFRKASKVNKKWLKTNKVQLQCGDFLETPLNPSMFNKIFCINVVYFWDDLQKPFEKIWSLLSSDGVFHIFMAKNDDLRRMKFTTDDIFNKYAIEQVIDTLHSAGFKTTDYYFKNGYYISARK